MLTLHNTGNNGRDWSRLTFSQATKSAIVVKLRGKNGEVFRDGVGGTEYSVVLSEEQARTLARQIEVFLGATSAKAEVIEGSIL